MTVRILLRQPASLAWPQRGFRWAEYLFLFVGLIALDYYIWISLDTTFYQAYESWTFDQQMKGNRVSFGRFLKDELGLLSAEGRSARVPASQPAASKTEAHVKRQTPVSNRTREKAKPLSVLGRITVPRLNLSAMVREGVGDDILRRAVGHIPSTAMPGQPGNVALAGHRDTFFRKLRDIRKNDQIVVSTLQGNFDYQVESVRIVSPDDISVIQPVGGEQALTLVTCYPFNYVGSAPKRFIVRARQIEVSPPQPQTGS